MPSNKRLLTFAEIGVLRIFQSNICWLREIEIRRCLQEDLEIGTQPYQKTWREDRGSVGGGESWEVAARNEIDKQQTAE